MESNCQTTHDGKDEEKYDVSLQCKFISLLAGYTEFLVAIFLIDFVGKEDISYFYELDNHIQN